jgi:hypothetical protein
LNDSEISLAQSAATFPLFKQCDSRWANQQLGTGKLTICQAGCAMSSTSMVLASFGVNTNPSDLNNWLKANGGDVDQDLILWASVAKYQGKANLEYYFRGAGSLSQAGLAAAVAAGKGVVVNVRNGGHWVLVTGGSGPNFQVNDPGFSVSSYAYSGMSNFVVYTRT